MEDRSKKADSEPGEGPPAPESPEAGPAPDGAAQTPPKDAGAVASKPGDGEPDAAEPNGPKESKETSGPERGRYVVEARYGALPVTGTATVTDPSIPKSSTCIIKTKRGTEMGVTLSATRPLEGDMGKTIGHVLRRSTGRDIERQRKIEDELEPNELKYCRQKIGERGLRMRLSGVEHIWGGERIVFFFTSERRVDFRALVRDLAWHFHTRIELRQIGARDEARLLGDFEHCGRPLCCKTFLRSLEPVTMRMAKLQRTTLDPSKISGRCGRLMCCLRFEDAVYRELRKGLPKRGMRVVVGSDEGVVASTEILTQEVTVRLQDGRTVHVPSSDLRPPDASPRTPAATPPDTSEAAKGQEGRADQSPSKDGGRRTGPSGASSRSGKRGRSRRRGRQDARKAQAGAAGSPPSVRTKPARSRKGRRRGGKGPKGRQGAGGKAAEAAGGKRPSRNPSKKTRPGS